MIFRVKSHLIDTNVSIQSTPTCRFNQHVGVLLIYNSVSTATSTYIKLTFREENCCNSHLQTFDRKQLNTRLENRTGSLKFVPNWNLVLFASTINTYFPAISIFCAGLGRRYPSEQPELADGRSGGSIGMALYYYSFVYCICYYTVITSLLCIITYSYYYIIITHYCNVVM